ncbi:MAG: hypothetical protein JNM33_12485 [Rubrivivax sp.]|nr:hypothetical protein [Rubrivivax sp.]
MATAAAGGLKLHVPSPDWRDQVIYFVMTDRFADGNPRNNDQGAGEHRPKEPEGWQGGDLAGLRAKLAYIQGLGATALWITPPVANQWLDPTGRHGGYHGYWAEHFMKVDRHLGTLADLQGLSSDLHRAGMFLVQDIVVNHTGNYFAMKPGHAAFLTTPPVARPSQWPFSLNDPRRAADRRAGIYHWTPDIGDYNDPLQEATFQMGGLDDLATDHPTVRQALRRSHGWWIRQAGVDAFRVDTAFYVSPEFFADFMHARDAAAPGIAEVARRTGRRDFLVFGEGFASDAPGADAASRRIESYMHDAAGRPRMNGMLNFPLYRTLGDVFARGAAPAQLAERLRVQQALHPRLHWMPTFVDNHDVDRFLAGAGEPALRQALLALMTLPGIPVIYYGTEQGFTEPRASMFAAGYGSGGRDRHDTSAPLYRAIAAMTALRRGDRLFSRGTPTVLAANAARAGALAWRSDHEGRSALVAFNTADTPTLAVLDTGLAPGTRLEGAFGLDGTPAPLSVGAGGRVVLELPAQAGRVWKALPGGQAEAMPTAAAVVLDPLPAERFEADFTLTGTAPGVRELRLVVDGDLTRAQTVRPGADGRFSARIDTSAMTDPALVHEVLAWAGGAAASVPRGFQVALPWKTVADVEDPAGDERWAYPTDPSYAPRPMDLRRVRVATAGGALRLELTTAAITTPWKPPNGFDHVLFTVYIELPGQTGGATVMPLQDGGLPEGLRWHRRLRVGGWTNVVHDAAGATATNEGRAVTPAARLQVDRATNTVSLVLPAASLGGLSSLSGARLYVTTWDYDGGYRALLAQPEAFSMGGTPGGPKVMDASAVITLP